MQLVHGLGEHLGRYHVLAAVLNAAGWHVAGHDHRGHGASGGPRGGIPDDAALMSDVAVVLDHVRTPGPHVLLGHSLGGLVAARFVAAPLLGPKPAWWRQVDALVLSSPAFDAGLNGWQRALLRTLRPLLPRLPVGNGLDPAWISRDRDVVQRYREDPLVHDRVTPRGVQFIVDAGAQVLSAAPRWAVPTLLLWAGADRCVAPSGSAAFAASAPADVVTSQVFPALFHEIFNEPERDMVFGHLTRWLARF